MSSSIGDRVRFQRHRKGWTQGNLADKAKADWRTIQRIEAGDNEPEPGTIRRLSEALGVDVSELRFGLSEEGLAALQQQGLCPTCGAALEIRTFVNHEYGDTELEVFACGASRGWRSRPCPKDPAFPRFDDYELMYFEDGVAVSCIAVGKTDAAKEVELSGGTGATREEAARWVERSFIQARDGSEAAEQFYPLFG